MNGKRKKRKRICSQSKKGNAVIDSILVIVVIIAFIVVTPIVYNLFKEIKPEIEADFNETNSTQAIAFLNQTEDKFPSIFDGIVVLLFIGLVGVAITASFMLDDHPIFFIFSLILLVFVCIAGAMLGNFYEEFFEDTEYSDVITDFPISYWIGTHMLELSIGIAISLLIALYAKSRSGL